MPTIPLDSFKLCVFSRHHAVEIGYTCISLFFGELTCTCTPSGISRGFRLSRIHGHHRLRSQKRLERQRNRHVKTKSHQNDRARRNHLLFPHLHISFDSRILPRLRKGADPPPFAGRLIAFLTLLIQPTLQLLPAIGNDVFLPIMISRLMISLKKAATAESGWSLSEMTSMRRVDEMRFVQPENTNRVRPSLDGDLARQGFRTSGTGGLDQLPADFFEEIGEAVARGLVEPSVSGKA